MSKRGFDLSAALLAMTLATSSVVAQSTRPVQIPPSSPKVTLTLPPQDVGLPYTRSSHAMAMPRIRDHVAVYPGSRYGYVKGLRVRLDDADPIDGEAVLRDGKVFVPEAFAGVLALSEIPADKAPPYLADKWVYTLDRPRMTIPDAAKIDLGGKSYVDLAAVARSMGLSVSQHPRGLLLIGQSPVSFTEFPGEIFDSVVTLFDTPEKFADPDIATKYIPTLANQGKWTTHVTVSDEQMKVLDGPEEKWPMTPASKFDFTGFNAKLLGSKVPAPGVYPRVLFSPEDVPMLASRIKSNVLGQKALIEMEVLFGRSWWDPNTDDGRVFKKLYTGDLEGLEFMREPGASVLSAGANFKGQTTGINNSHVMYNAECLCTMAFYALMTGNDELGKKVATATANYFRLREPLIDELNASSDTEDAVLMGANVGATTWRGMHGVAPNMNLGLCLDFAGKWMSDDEKELMRRVIAKATYGRRAFGQDGPKRFRDINWVSWDTPQYLALCAIEGLEGFDPDGERANRDTLRAFCEWGIDQDGVIYESNGKSGAGVQFQMLGMVAMARRGENLWGHPHWRKLLDGQVESTSPSGFVTVTSGTQYVRNSRQGFSNQVVMGYKGFYPDNKSADYLMTRSADGVRAFTAEGFDPAAFRAEVEKDRRRRLPSVTYPAMTNGVLYDTDAVTTTREQLDLPLDFNAPVHGVYSAYSDRSKNGTWMHMMVRPDHYLGAGHHHADAGMFHFSALGVDWITESAYSQASDGKFHNEVVVDGVAEGPGYQAAATYLGMTPGVDGKASAASADMTYAYSYRWLTQPGQSWDTPEPGFGFEMEPSERIMKMFAGTTRYKMRPWWPSYNWSNYIATSRVPHNTMQYVYRSVGLVRGEQAYGIVVDDAKKDEKTRLYEWTAMPNLGVWQADVAGLAANQLALAYVEPDEKAKKPKDPSALKPMLAPKPGDPIVIVTALGLTDTGDPSLPIIHMQTLQGMPTKTGDVTYYDRVAITRKADLARFRVLLTPARYGQPLPTITWDDAKQSASVKVGGREDVLTFSPGADQRTRFNVSSAGQTILDVK